MKKIIPGIIIILAAYFIAGCSTKFNVAAPYQNTTVIYGFLDEADTAHYIRVQKAFLDENKSALTLAQVADSNFYANLNVRMEEIDISNGGSTFIDTLHLSKVDLNLEGYPKQAGTFFNTPNYAYKFKKALNPSYSYRLVVTNLSTGVTDSAETPLIDDNNVVSNTFVIPIIDNLITNLVGLDFSATAASVNTYIKITGNYNPIPNFNFDGQLSPAYIAQAVLTFNWIDSNTINGTETYHSYDYNAGYTNLANRGFAFQIDNLSLYNAIASGMGAAPSGIDRLLLRCNLAIYLSTIDFANYQQNTLTQGTGLTANEIEPIYTNIKGAHALGLFTSRGLRGGAVGIDTRTLDSLMINPITVPAHITGFAH